MPQFDSGWEKYRPANPQESFRSDNSIKTNSTQQIFIYRDMNVALSNLNLPFQGPDGSIREVNVGDLTNFLHNSPAAYLRFLQRIAMHDQWLMAEALFEVDHEPTLEQ